MDDIHELGNLPPPDRLSISPATHEDPNRISTDIPQHDNTIESQPTSPQTWRFWAIITALAITGLMSAIEGTIITSALPSITNALGGGDAYIWVPNAYLLAQVAILPLAGQASNIFGRRHLLLGSVALFTLGGGLSGAASSMGMLIAARTIQGLGGGGINLLMETIVTDIVPLRERGQYMAIVGIGAVVGATLGPFLGGLITDHASWRWCFYINVPIGIASFGILFIFLRVKYDRNLTWSTRLRRIDISGNAIFVAAIVSALMALTWGGTIYSWSTYHIVVPLVLGLIGILLFAAFEWTPRLCPEPSFPRQVVSNRTSAAALALTFIHAIVAYWVYYFLPIYFQAVRGLSPLRSGIYTLPNVAGGLVFAVLGGVLLSKSGRYKPLHLAGFAVTTVSFGLFSLLDARSSDAAWVCIQLLNALGSGMLSGVLLPAVQAPLDESYVATATGVWSFARYFGCIWGVTIPSAVFNNECRRLASTTITDAGIAGDLAGDSAYQHATGAFLHSIQDPALRAEVVQVFTGAMRTVWLVGIAFAALGFLVSFIAKEIELRKELNNDFGVEDKKDAVISPATEMQAVPSSSV
ncbi:putative efflux pump antibiotic resistance protein [Trichoderma reesei RUT C-30]|uniref:Putative efflux pump antibiotic resistance protein n=1 Tax=Hypocrea jecorina (strain ATCC 56765 / BCRC 32924 / NRRL 11460 / Rut C-30) TaxID=1344414 RepID=A0A024SNB4_HYPJR|nr:putative efflux pump antibiotic resistance protein [Trichoderma reesei RUT C-30]